MEQILLVAGAIVATRTLANLWVKNSKAFQTVVLVPHIYNYEHVSQNTEQI